MRADRRGGRVKGMEKGEEGRENMRKEEETGNKRKEKRRGNRGR